MAKLDQKLELIVIIDDNPIDLYLASRLIGKNNLSSKLLQFTSAEKALHYLIENQKQPEAWPQLMLVDIYMPGMSGFEFMEAYREFPESLRKKCCTYIVSSSINESDISRANQDENVEAFQEKPITLGFLEHSIERAGFC